ncbi:MAG: BlaI/MecI/CopY family transcriptional regulator [Planctomycetota bacterium]|nr:BlaI/MecI/CopY family transcriptional regulator [Planctomycetota bacterium]
MPPRESDLSEAELEVLKVLWDEGPLMVRDVLNCMLKRGRKLAYTTVLTFLSRLEHKGYVKSDKSEMAYVYKPTISRDGVAKTRVKSFLQQLYDGSAGPLVLQLMKEESFTEDEITQLQAMLDNLEVKPGDDEAGSKSKRRRRKS